MQLRIRNTGYEVYGKYMWRIEEKGWFFWPMFATAYIWAKTAEEAKRLYLMGTEKE